MVETVIERLMAHENQDAVAAELLALENGNPRIKRQVENGVREKRHKFIETITMLDISTEEAEEMLDMAIDVFMEENGHYDIPEPLVEAEAIDVFTKYLLEEITEEED